MQPVTSHSLFYIARCEKKNIFNDAMDCCCVTTILFFIQKILTLCSFTQIEVDRTFFILNLCYQLTSIFLTRFYPVSNLFNMHNDVCQLVIDFFPLSFSIFSPFSCHHLSHPQPFVIIIQINRMVGCMWWKLFIYYIVIWYENQLNGKYLKQ